MVLTLQKTNHHHIIFITGVAVCLFPLVELGTNRSWLVYGYSYLHDCFTVSIYCTRQKGKKEEKKGIYLYDCFTVSTAQVKKEKKKKKRVFTCMIVLLCPLHK